MTARSSQTCSENEMPPFATVLWGNQQAALPNLRGRHALLVDNTLPNKMITCLLSGKIIGGFANCVAP